MVHLVPDSSGKITVDRTENKNGYLVVNLDVANNVTVTPEQETAITLKPYCKMKVPDKIGCLFQGGSSSRNYIVMSWEVQKMH